MARRGVMFGAAGVLVAGAIWWRSHPSACPYAARWSLDFLRPGLGPSRLLDALELRGGERVLEVGPGTGHYTLPVARRVARLDALDLQPAMLRAVERRAAREDISNVVTRQGDARSLPYEDAAFDGVFMVTVLGEVPDRPSALREVRRVLRPGGCAVFGEIVLDPHVVTAGTLRRECEAAGLVWVARHGSPLAFFARVERPPAG